MSGRSLSRGVHGKLWSTCELGTGIAPGRRPCLDGSHWGHLLANTRQEKGWFSPFNPCIQIFPKSLSPHWPALYDTRNLIKPGAPVTWEVRLCVVEKYGCSTFSVGATKKFFLAVPGLTFLHPFSSREREGTEGFLESIAIKYAGCYWSIISSDPHNRWLGD